MARKHKKKKSKKQPVDPYAVLEEKVVLTAYELVRLIHRINPTSKESDPEKASARYELKSGLQSLLIRRFEESLFVEPPNAEDPDLVGIRLRHYDENACHARISELDEDAASWVRNRIDEAGTDDLVELQASPTLGAGRHDRPSKQPGAGRAVPNDAEKHLDEREMIRAGRKALENYDYETAEIYFLRALKASGGGLEPALSILNVYVDHLAAYEKALALWESFSRITRKNENVRMLMAIAAAGCGRFEAALTYADGVTEPRIVEACLPVAKHLVRNGEDARVERILTVLKSFDDVALKPEVENLERELLAVRARKVEPVEKAMMQAWRQGRFQEAVELSNRILSVLPQNKAACRVRREHEKQQRMARIDELLARADEARSRNDCQGEADLLRKATALGAAGDALGERIKEAEKRAQIQKREADCSTVIDLWTGGNPEAAFLHFSGLDVEQRRQILDVIDDERFRWLEEIFSAEARVKPQKAADAVLALGRAKKVLKKGEQPEPAIEEINLHYKVLAPLFEARQLLQQAESLLQSRESRRNKERLDKARRILSGEVPDIPAAKDAMAGIKTGQLGKDDRSRFEDLRVKLSRLERIQLLERQYHAAADAEDYFECISVARELIEYGEQDEANYWRDEIEGHRAAIKSQWCLLETDFDEAVAPFGVFGTRWLFEWGGCVILADRRHVVVVTGHERWVFVRTLSLDDQRFKKAIVFRAPKPVSYPGVSVAGNALWIAGESGHVIHLGLDPLKIEGWYDGSRFVDSNEIVETAFLFPASRSLWLEKRDSKSGFDTWCQVINLDQRLVVRRIKSFFSPLPINCSGKFRIAVCDRQDKAVRIYSEEGRLREKDAVVFKRPRMVHEVACHPNGVDLVLLTFDEVGSIAPLREVGDGVEYPYGDQMLTLEVRPDIDEKNRPHKIEDSNGELPHNIASSLQTGIVFVCFATDSSNGRGFELAAFTPSPNGLEPLYRLKVPPELVLTTDEDSGQVAALSLRGKCVQAATLGEIPPVFECDTRDPVRDAALPSFDTTWVCANPTGPVKAQSLAHMARLQALPLEALPGVVKQTKENDDPEEMEALILALERMLNFEAARELRLWMKDRYGQHPRVLYDFAIEAAKERKWGRVISLLETVARADLDDGTACHMCHLLGMAYFAEGDAEKALKAWREGLGYSDGACDLEPYVAYAKLSLMSEGERKGYKAASDMLSTLRIYERIDEYLNNQDWDAVIETVKRSGCMDTSDLQLQGRFTEAYLHKDYTQGEREFVFKIVVLANYCDEHGNRAIGRIRVLPPYMETFSEERLEDIARRASQWLQDVACRQNR